MENQISKIKPADRLASVSEYYFSKKLKEVARMNAEGKDVISGGVGADDLFGGAGADTFVYSSLKDSTVAASGRDNIYDFSRAEGDRIDLRLIDAVSGGGDNAFVLVNQFSKIAGQLTAKFAGGATLVQGDVNGDGVADFSINVVSKTALVAGDFLL